MFSFFKFLQKFVSNLKSNKGLWFTILAVISISGIFLSLYLLTHMTQTVSKDVYINMSSSYTKNYKNRVNQKEQSLKKIALSVETNKEFMDSIKNEKIDLTKEIITNFNNKYKENGFNSIKLNFYPAFNQINQYRNSINSVINTNDKAFGLEVLSDGVFYVYLEPIISNDVLIGVLELKENLNNFKSAYEKEDLLFAFLIEERMLNRLSIKTRDGKYKDVVDTLYVQENEYNSKFIAKIKDASKDGYKKMIDEGYLVDDLYFKSAQKVSDLEGNIIGYVIIGEPIEGSGAFVNIVDNMTKTVTTVALGLVISILLFMF